MPHARKTLLLLVSLLMLFLFLQSCSATRPVELEKGLLGDWENETFARRIGEPAAAVMEIEASQYWLRFTADRILVVVDGQELSGLLSAKLESYANDPEKSGIQVDNDALLGLPYLQDGETFKLTIAGIPFQLKSTLEKDTLTLSDGENSQTFTRKK